jgi:hypothetical protein
MICEFCAKCSDYLISHEEDNPGLIYPNHKDEIDYPLLFALINEHVQCFSELIDSYNYNMYDIYCCIRGKNAVKFCKIIETNNYIPCLEILGGVIIYGNYRVVRHLHNKYFRDVSYEDVLENVKKQLKVKQRENDPVMLSRVKFHFKTNNWALEL